MKYIFSGVGLQIMAPLERRHYTSFLIKDIIDNIEDAEQVADTSYAGKC